MYILISFLYILERDRENAIHPPELLIREEDIVKFTCNYSNPKWFYSESPQLPLEDYFSRGPVLDFTARMVRGGHYFCVGFRNNRKKYISRALLEVVRKHYVFSRILLP